MTCLLAARPISHGRIIYRTVTRTRTQSCHDAVSQLPVEDVLARIKLFKRMLVVVRCATHTTAGILILLRDKPRHFGIVVYLLHVCSQLARADVPHWVTNVRTRCRRRIIKERITHFSVLVCPSTSTWPLIPLAQQNFGKKKEAGWLVHERAQGFFLLHFNPTGAVCAHEDVES